MLKVWSIRVHGETVLINVRIRFFHFVYQQYAIPLSCVRYICSLAIFSTEIRAYVFNCFVSLLCSLSSMLFFFFFTLSHRVVLYFHASSEINPKVRNRWVCPNARAYLVFGVHTSRKRSRRRMIDYLCQIIQLSYGNV